MKTLPTHFFLGLFLATPLALTACNGDTGTGTGGDTDSDSGTDSDTDSGSSTTGSTDSSTTTTTAGTDSGSATTTDSTSASTTDGTTTDGTATGSTSGTTTGGQTCEECIARSCSEELDACANDENCQCWTECIGSGGTQQECFAECGAPSRVTQDLGACVNDNCAVACEGGGGTGGTGGSTGGVTSCDQYGTPMQCFNNGCDWDFENSVCQDPVATTGG